VIETRLKANLLSAQAPRLGPEGKPPARALDPAGEHTAQADARRRSKNGRSMLVSGGS
jgi:hypothetical protein